MKHITIVVFSLSASLILNCTKKGEKQPLNTSVTVDTLLEIPDTTVEKSTLHYNNKISVWTLNDEPYSGYAVSFHEDSTLKEKVGILDGRKESQSTIWYADGHLRQTANYYKGRLHGEKKVWSQDTNHVLISQLHYKSGSPHGEQKKWYLTGELHKVLHLNMISFMKI